VQREESGYFSGSAEIGAGARYRFRVNNAEHFHPDPARVFSPMVRTVLRALSIQPSSNGATRHGPEKIEGQIIYEMHVGTFTSGRKLGGRRRTLSGAARMASA